MKKDVVVVAIIRDGKVLCGKRLYKSYIGCYQLVGGCVETGETIFEAGTREAQEEVGIDIRLTACEVKDTVKWPSTTNLDHINTVHYILATTDQEPNVPDNEKHKCNDWAWYNLDEVPTPQAPPLEYFLKTYGRFLKYGYIQSIEYSGIKSGVLSAEEDSIKVTCEFIWDKNGYSNNGTPS